MKRSTPIIQCKTTMLLLSVMIMIFVFKDLYALTPDGFNSAQWGSSPDNVRQVSGVTGWVTDPTTNEFPKELNVTVFRGQTDIAGYRATVKYYFFENKFFQATAQFNFDDLKNYDFNYNVYRSVNQYYLAVRSKTITFVQDIYDLLQKKYGKKEPVFKGLDPRWTFTRADAYIKQERWNLRYHPYDYYTRIVASAYARWDFPKTHVTFSINISAPDKRFDYILSLTSAALETEVNAKKDQVRSKNL